MISADDMDSIFHSRFTYVFVPADIDSQAEVRAFSGREGDFKNCMREHFQRNALKDSDRPKLKQSIQDQIDEQMRRHKPSQGEGEGGGGEGESKITDVTDDETTAASAAAPEKDKATGSSSRGLADSEMMDRLVEATSNYQIIPLTLPMKANGYIGINAYIDDIGRIKDLPVNARASRITSEDIRGDCFISSTFDDEMDFRRESFDKRDYERMLENPPESRGRWNISNALQQLHAAAAPQPDTTQAPAEKKCHNCGKRAAGDGEVAGEGERGADRGDGGDSVNRVRLQQCARCKRVVYCSKDCQVKDWKFHKRVCKAS
ncbi:unnamed protein product [Vitrella brassicaformis CCMP3155]|uniref:MYND-type domain-containing protein n=1 Tax=Vitrella brassicaformis (strain CCMP3155) TaxID=1169540 RepID=A0A0G4EF08_VITBC|nr:unnamed protein product [Vitrella brassicaformis CCMP3155]|eukprot:CEL94000.1 unnamed protein product [Vitrella brassicaformis CCMP3155]